MMTPSAERLREEKRQAVFNLFAVRFERVVESRFDLGTGRAEILLRDWRALFLSMDR